MSYELILSTDTLDQGRIKINSFVNSTTGVWSSDTSNYSIFSRIGATNFGQSFGNYNFLVGVNNSGITGNYSSVVGGKNNSTNGSFNLIGNGYKNKVKTAGSTYINILNGKYNYVSTSILSSYSTIINGKNNQLNKAVNSIILGGTNNTLKGTNSFLFGTDNKIYSSPSSTVGPNLCSILNGGGSGVPNVISGNNLTFCNIIGNGFNNVINQFGSFGTASGFFNYNYISGLNNKIMRAGAGASSFHNFLKGSNLSTTLDGGILNGGFNLIFGKGSSLASPLNPKYSYEVVLGNSSSRKFRINFNNGKAYGTQGALTWQGTGADYGEYFEWKDKNINNEERTGFFVEIVDGKIEIAKSDNVVGIISKTTTFVGDSVQDYWSEMHLKDEWGSVLTQKYEMYKFQEGELSKDVYFDQNGVCFIELPNYNNVNGVFNDNYKKEEGTYIKDIDSEIMNPNYDPSKNYIPRKNRKEWEVVGLLGKMKIRTSEQITGNFVDVDTNTGMAKNGTKYPVMQKTKDFDGNYGIVLIFFK